jgi:hypothetical protein
MSDSLVSVLLEPEEEGKCRVLKTDTLALVLVIESESPCCGGTLG